MSQHSDHTPDQLTIRRDSESHSEGAPAFTAGDAVPGLSSWILERKLGGGGFGAVWLARHAIDRERKPVAFKFCTDPVARHRLVTHERNVVARVMQHAGKHPNIVPLLEYNLDGDVPWLMYEYVEGGTLAALTEEWQPLPLPKRLGRAVKVLHQIANALAVMHRLTPPIVHRDLKPANILMAGVVPRITDFGIGGVALLETSADSTGAYTAGAAKLPTNLLRSGTLLYSSPEQRHGAPPRPRDDVYALGVIAYQLVLGDRVSQPGTDSFAEMCDQNVPTKLATLIVRSVALNPERRPTDANEWSDALAELDEELGAAPTPRVANSSQDCDGPGERQQQGDRALPYEVVEFDTEPNATELGLATGGPEVPATESEDRTSRRLDPTVAVATFVVMLACALIVVTLGYGLFVFLEGNSPIGGAPPALTEPLPGEEREFELAPRVKSKFSYIPAGMCQLGAPAEELSRLAIKNPDEAEVVRGSFSTAGFWLGKYEVTQAEWAAVMAGTDRETPSEFRLGGEREAALGPLRDTTRFPVENVSWFDCCQFLERANAHATAVGLMGTFDLPHEDEWEYACRGGMGNARPFYFGLQLNGAQANCDGNFPYGTTTKGFALKRPQPVGSYEQKVPHSWGLCDTHGNVWEWCRNECDQPKGRAVRGGSWLDYAHHCRSALRAGFEPSLRHGNLGLRLAFFPRQSALAPRGK